jgi:dihydrofolate reductase
VIVSAIVACAKNNIIGKDNQIPWYLPADLAYFKRTTLNHHIIMGRNSFESIGRPLPKRTNIVITRDPFFIATGVHVAHSIQEALQIAARNGETEAFIIGGGEIYRQSVAYWDKLYLTEVDLDTEGDVFFPKMDWDKWRLISEDCHQIDDKNEWAYAFKVFEKI